MVLYFEFVIDKNRRQAYNEFKKINRFKIEKLFTGGIRWARKTKDILSEQ